MSSASPGPARKAESSRPILDQYERMETNLLSLPTEILESICKHHLGDLHLVYDNDRTLTWHDTGSHPVITGHFNLLLTCHWLSHVTRYSLLETLALTVVEPQPRKPNHATRAQALQRLRTTYLPHVRKLRLSHFSVSKPCAFDFFPSQLPRLQVLTLVDTEGWHGGTEEEILPLDRCLAGELNQHLIDDLLSNMANLDPTKWPRTPELYNLLLDRKRSFQVRYKTHWLLKAPVQDGKSSQAIIVRIPHALIVLILSSVQPQCIEFEPLTREIFSWKVIKDPKRLLNITYMQNVEQTFDALPQQSAELTLKDITRFGGRYLTAFDRWWIHIPPTRT